MSLESRSWQAKKKKTLWGAPTGRQAISVTPQFRYLHLYCNSQTISALLTRSGTCRALRRERISALMSFCSSFVHIQPSCNLMKRITRSSIPPPRACPTARQSTTTWARSLTMSDPGLKHMSRTSYNSAEPKRIPPGFLYKHKCQVFLDKAQEEWNSKRVGIEFTYSTPSLRPSMIKPPPLPPREPVIKTWSPWSVKEAVSQNQEEISALCSIVEKWNNWWGGGEGLRKWNE